MPEASRRKLARQHLLLQTASMPECFGVNNSPLPARAKQQTPNATCRWQSRGAEHLYFEIAADRAESLSLQACFPSVVEAQPVALKASAPTYIGCCWLQIWVTATCGTRTKVQERALVDGEYLQTARSYALQVLSSPTSLCDSNRAMCVSTAEYVATSGVSSASTTSTSAVSASESMLRTLASSR